MKSFIESSEDRGEAFKRLANELCILAAVNGVDINPYAGNTPKRFLSLPNDFQAATLAHFDAYVAVAREVQAQEHSLHNDQVFLWRMFQKLRAHTAAGFMDQIAKGEVIEIHNSSFVQIYRNIKFFSLCSYTLDDLLCRPFWELYERDEEITKSLIAVATEFFNGRMPGIHDMGVPQHTVLEIDSAARLLVRVQQRIGAQLSNSEGKSIGIVVAVTAGPALRTAPRIEAPHLIRPD